MRFDDRLATILACPLGGADERVAAWRQIVDILAQAREGEPDPLSDEALDLVRHLRAQVPAAVRAEAARAIAGRRLPRAVVALIGEEPPVVAAQVLGAARLDPEAWLDLLPALPATSRALLRHRRDLGAAVERALASFGAADFALPPGEAAAAPAAAPTLPDVGDGGTQIRDLLARIAAYREGRPIVAEAAPAPPESDAFRFETGADGLIAWVDGAPRGALVGETIAAAAARADHGVDGHAAGAFRRRAPFRDARLTVAGVGPVAGEWRISAVPVFAEHDGRFAGYRGTARRPRADERATPTPDRLGLLGPGLAPDSLRQLVHELRTPLNAIVGFAEMIERQMLGPAGHEYRARAGDIGAQGRRLLAAVDDLDMAARVESRRLALAAAPVDAAGLLARLHADYEAPAAARGVRLAFRIGPELPPVEADPVAVERMVARLLGATIGLAAAGETVSASLDHDERGVALHVPRPAAISGRDERALLDPGYSPEGDWPDAPLLGLGFALRLIRNLAAGAGGALDIGADAFVLRLPRARGAALSGNG